MKILASLFSQSKYLGISLEHKHASLVVGAQRDGKTEIVWQKTFINETNVFSSTDALISFLSNILQSLPDKFKSQYLPVQIALPDSLFCMHKLYFSDFPRQKIERDALVNWQLARMSHRKSDAFCTTWQFLNEDNKGRAVFACGIDRAIINAIKAALKQSGFWANTVNAALCYRNNILSDAIQTSSSALVTVEKDYWNIIIWDTAGKFNYQHSAEREIEHEDSIKNIIAEAERLIWSYISQTKAEEIKNIYLIATIEEKAVIESEMNQRLQKQCKLLSVSDILGIRNEDIGLVEMATVMPQ